MAPPAAPAVALALVVRIYAEYGTLTEEGIRSLILEEADSISFADPRLQQQVDRALAALARHNERDRRQITVRLDGQGERAAMVGYVVEVPLWKATYRLTLPADPAAGISASRAPARRRAVRARRRRR